jgi:L-lactate utilization protein LutC
MSQKCQFCGREAMTNGLVAHLQDCPARQMMNTASQQATNHAAELEWEFCQKLKKIVREALEEHERDKRRDT